MRFFLERTARAIFTVWVAMSIAFALIRLIPSGPVQIMKANLQTQHPGWSQERINAAVQTRARRMNLYLDEPIWTQYYYYMRGIFTGDLGMSFHESEPVMQIIAQSVPWTVFVMTTATIMVFAIAIVWGALIAYREGSLFDSVSSSIAIMMSAVPFYVLAFALILVLGYWVDGMINVPFIPGPNDIPQSGQLSAFQEVALTPRFVIDALRHAMLPILSVVLSQAGLWALAMRGNSIQELGEDYVRVARLRGLPDRRIATRYVARNAILPMYTGFLTLIGFNLGASIILEQVFDYRGMGWYMYKALVEWRDYALIMGIFLVFTLALVLAVYVADLTYGYIDPRVKQGESSEAY